MKMRLIRSLSIRLKAGQTGFSRQDQADAPHIFFGDLRLETAANQKNRAGCLWLQGVAATSRVAAGGG
jgi:hypothetical protein